MKGKAIFLSTLIVILVSSQSYALSSSSFTQDDFIFTPVLNDDLPYFENTVFITWDGTNYKWLEELMNNGTLVNMNRVLGSNGYKQNVRITSHETNTGACLACIETGHGPDITGISSNQFGPGSDKLSIPDGDTTGERLKASFASDIKLGYALSWSFHQINEEHLAQTGNYTDSIFENIIPGREADFWFASENLSWTPGDPESIEASLLTYHADRGLYMAPLIRAPFLAEKAADWLVNVTDERFYLRIHFTEPDQAGHGYREAKKGAITPEYMQSLVECDIGTGIIFDALENAGVLNKTLFIVGADHGMYEGSHGGSYWPAQNDQASTTTFVINNGSFMHPLGDGIPINQKDIAPTILASMGVDMTTITPEYVGDEDTGLVFWDFTESDTPEIHYATYKTATDTDYQEINKKARIEGIVDIRLVVRDWCMALNGSLQIGDQVYYSASSTYKSVQWNDVDFSAIEGKTSELVFTITDKFGNSATSTIKAAPTSVWFSMAGIFVIGSIYYFRRKRK